MIVGNPIMHHIVLGIDPTPLGQAPFTLASAEPVRTHRPLDLGLDFPTARVFIGPCIAGHVGADTTAAMLAEGPHRGEHWQLLVDVGTNAEIVLGCTAAAVRRVAARPGRRSRAPRSRAVSGPPPARSSECASIATRSAPRFKVIGCDLWSDDPAFAAATEHLTITGVCGSGIIEVIAEMYLAGVIDTDGVVRGELADSCPHIVADGRTFRYVLHRRATRSNCRSPRTTSAPSSSPRPRCAPASTC